MNSIAGIDIGKRKIKDIEEVAVGEEKKYPKYNLVLFPKLILMPMIT